MTYQEMATNPSQYDLGEVDWQKEGEKNHFTRRLIFEALLPQLDNVEDRRVLDVGSGLGWLCDELTARGANTTGIEPSTQNIDAAKEHYPRLDFRHTTLEEFDSTEIFEIITAVMVFEHLGQLRKSFDRTKQLLSSRGRLVIVTGDFDRFTNPRHGVTVDVEKISDGEAATRTDYGERAGVLYDILRTPERIMLEASHCGLNTVLHEPILIPDWLKNEEPRYIDFGDKPVFQIFSFEHTK